MKQKIYLWALVGLITILTILPLQEVHAQRITHNFRNTSMSEALTLLAKSTKDYRINFVYNELEDFCDMSM